jgi:AraC family transcriptional regulator of arabinose operon
MDYLTINLLRRRFAIDILRSRNSLVMEKTELRRDGFPRQRMIVLPPPIVLQARQLPVIQDLLPTAIGHFPMTAGHYVSRHEGVPDIILIYCVDGSGWCEFADRRWDVRAGNAIFLPKTLAHTYAANERKPWSIYWVHFTGQRSMDYLKIFEVTPDSPMIHLPPVAEIISTFEDTYSCLQYGYSFANLLALSTNLGRFLSLLNLHRHAANLKTRTTDENIQQSIRFMHENAEKRLYLEELAQLANLSVTHYSTLFKRRTGYSPTDYFIRMKIQQACQLLGMTEEPVQNICQKLGYEDPYYFSRIFKKVMGRTPTGYRKMSAFGQKRKRNLAGVLPAL